MRSAEPGKRISGSLPYFFFSSEYRPEIESTTSAPDAHTRVAFRGTVGLLRRDGPGKAPQNVRGRLTGESTDTDVEFIAPFFAFFDEALGYNLELAAGQALARLIGGVYSHQLLVGRLKPSTGSDSTKNGGRSVREK